MWFKGVLAPSNARLATILAAAVLVAGAGSAPVSAGDLWRGSYGGSLKDGGGYVPANNAWGGLYVGGHLGAGWRANDKATLDDALAGDLDGDGTLNSAGDVALRGPVRGIFDHEELGMHGGLHIGSNATYDRWVFGVEGDLSFGNDVDLLSSLRARGGLVLEGVLVYGTAGIAYAQFDRPDTIASLTTRYIVENDSIGYALGGGFETAIAQQLLFGVEGIYYHFDADTEVGNVVVDNDLDVFALRARLSYQLGERAAHQSYK